jgi:hypothetical protein
VVLGVGGKGSTAWGVKRGSGLLPGADWWHVCWPQVAWEQGCVALTEANLDGQLEISVSKSMADENFGECSERLVKHALHLQHTIHPLGWVCVFTSTCVFEGMFAASLVSGGNVLSSGKTHEVCAHTCSLGARCLGCAGAME